MTNHKTHSARMEQMSRSDAALKAVASYIRDGYVIISAGCSSVVLRHHANGTKVIVTVNR